MIRVSLRGADRSVGLMERISVGMLVVLAAVSVLAAVAHMRSPARMETALTRSNAAAGQAIALKQKDISMTQPVTAAPPRPAAAVTPASAPEPAPVPAPAVEVAAKEAKNEPEKIARNSPPANDMDSGEADRGVPSDTATVVARQKDLPLLRDDQAFETWGGEYAKGDSRLKEMIVAGALTSIRRGAKVKILEVRGPLAHIEVIGEGRTGWIRTSSVGR